MAEFAFDEAPLPDFSPGFGGPPRALCALAAAAVRSGIAGLRRVHAKHTLVIVFVAQGNAIRLRWHGREQFEAGLKYFEMLHGEAIDVEADRLPTGLPCEVLQ